jgi:hypothetical protein
MEKKFQIKWRRNSGLISSTQKGREKWTEIVKKEKRKVPVEGGILEPEKKVWVGFGGEVDDGGRKRVGWTRLTGKIIDHVEQRGGATG